jgi:hypothetical protein
VPFAMYAKASGSSTPGPQGEPGEPGAQGTNGTPGIQGETGTAGADGTNGASGSNGAKGDQGIQGDQGVKGTAGADGATGTAGAAGTNGEKGETGEQGAIGATGFVGAQGDIGAAGPSGETGETGTDGTQGIQGEIGATGAQGVIGETGATGVQGNIGATGAQGPVGADGIGIAQTLLISGDTLFISSGNYIIIPGLSLINSLIVEGCNDPTAFNYDASANTDDGSCIAVVNGCMDPTAFNYDASANIDDGSCIAVVNGCTDPTAFNYDASANTDDGSCIAVVNGCTDPTAFNYDASANTDDGSCIAVVNGCTDPIAFNYDASANTDDGSCIAVVNGCTDPLYTEYDASANTDDGSCTTLVVNGCTDPIAFNYDALANTDDGSCIAVVNGCTNPTAFNYNGAANTDDGSCTYLAIGDTYQGGIVFYLDGNGGGLIAAPTDQSTGAEWGCRGNYLGADGTAIGTGAQNTINIETGCTTSGTAADICANLTFGGYSDWFLPSKDELNLMWLNLADSDGDGINTGPSDPNNLGGFSNNDEYWSSTEFDSEGDDGKYIAWIQSFSNGNQSVSSKSYTEPGVRAVRAFGGMTIYGCTDPTAFNYNNALANTDDGSCIAVVNGCMDPTAFNYDASANTDGGTCRYTPIIGETHQGGIVFYLDGNGGGLIAAPTDQSTGAEWGCWSTNLSGADGTAIGTGAQNTIDIVNANCSPYTPGNSIAANICANLTLGGYSDWFLPSKDELNLMWINLADSDGNGFIAGPTDPNNIGGFTQNFYWSSTEYYVGSAWLQYFGSSGTQTNGGKKYTDDVRAVRAF